MNRLIEDIAAEVGFTAACKLIEWFGNRTIRIPKEPSRDHPIAVVIGTSALARLCAIWGDENIYIQSPTRMDLEQRAQLIAALLARGVSEKTVAEIVGLTKRRVQQMRRSLEQRGLLPLILSGEVGARWSIEQKKEADTEHV